MSWFDRLFRGSSMDPTGTVSFPLVVDLVAGVFRAHVFFHQIDTQRGPISCWSYITDGLRLHGQKELVLTLRCEADETAHDFPKDPLRLFASIRELAQQGRIVDVGGVTQLGKRDFFSRHLAYVDSQPLPGVVIPTDALAAILVTEDELQAVQEFGILRVMSRLGFASRHYPWPSWSDRSRAELSFRQIRQDSILSRVPRGRARGVRVIQEGRQTEIRVGPDASKRLQKTLAGAAADAPMALLTDLDPRANGCLVWEPGRPAPGAITPPGSDGSRLCGCFALFVPGQPANEVRIVEDGFGLMLTDNAWAQIRRALLQDEEAASISCNGGERIVVEQVQTTYWNPIDSKGFMAEWQTYQPQNRHSEAQTRTTLDHVRLLDEQVAYERELGVQRLGEFCKRIEAAVDEIIRVSAASYDLLIEVVVSPEREPGFRLASKGEAPQEELQRINAVLLELDEVKSRAAELTFQMYFKAGGGLK